MRRATRNFLGALAIVAVWTFVLDNDTRAAITGPKKRDVIDVEVKR